ncbi:esterase [Legionella busanensis]|uniref:Esterase n=1 Tax=Legionella busanensis TaxID=190655 RepID=A0A378JIG7_9GAMM|nr:hotdog fold thioesterase [Legionella busanensis]STX51106.1 esterase [Legionella busanensis]
MAIWFNPISIEYVNQRNQNTLADFLGIKFIEIGDDFLVATMPANERTKQPLGIIHGGANVVLAETLASVAANSVVDLNKFYCVGLEINANHIRPVSKGIVKGITRPIHIGRTTHVWQIDMYSEEGKRSCVSRMTASVVAR